tara:strand:+ start:634 stop:1302 length:669 start_codon:yes stop_codon:yes gene_type:complete
MLKLKTLLKEDNHYPADAPEHFGSGKNIDIFGFQTKHFDICGTAVVLYNKLKENDEHKDLIVASAKEMDHLFEMEKQVVMGEKIDHDPIKHSVELINTISFKLGRLAELTNHSEGEKDTDFLKDHVLVIINRRNKMSESYDWRKFREWQRKLNEGPAYEYAREVKNIEKIKAAYDKEVNTLIKKVARQDKKASKEINRVWTNYNREYSYFKRVMEDELNKLA